MYMYSLFVSNFISSFQILIFPFEVVLAVICIEFASICFSSFTVTHFTSMLTFKRITSF